MMNKRDGTGRPFTLIRGLEGQDAFLGSTM